MFSLRLSKICTTILEVINKKGVKLKTSLKETLSIGKSERLWVRIRVRTFSITGYGLLLVLN